MNFVGRVEVMGRVGGGGKDGNDVDSYLYMKFSKDMFL